MSICTGIPDISKAKAPDAHDPGGADALQKASAFDWNAKERNT